MKYKVQFKDILEIIAALGVIISLIFVGVEMNENTKATRSAIAAETTALISDWYNSLADNPETSRLLRAYTAYPETLSPDERYRAIMKTHSIMMIMQSAFYLEEEGTLDTKIRDSITIVFKSVAHFPGIVDYWKVRRGIFTNEDFIAFMDEAVQSENKMVVGDIYTPKDDEKQ